MIAQSHFAGIDPQKIIMVSDEHFLGPILAHENFLLAACKKNLPSLQSWVM